MQQYSPKNQAFLLAQMPTATDVRPFKAWKAAGRSVRKGEKALRVWIPKHRNTKGLDPETMSAAELDLHFTRGPVFDISQTKEATPRQQKERDSILSEHRHEQAWSDYAAAIDAGDIPDTLDFADWYELREETIRLKATTPAAGTVATPAGAVIAEYQHITA